MSEEVFSAHQCYTETVTCQEKAHLVKFFPRCMLAQPHIFSQFFLKIGMERSVMEKKKGGFEKYHSFKD